MVIINHVIICAIITTKIKNYLKMNYKNNNCKYFNTK